VSDLRKAIETLEGLRSSLQIQHRPGPWYGVDLTEEIEATEEAMQLLSQLETRLLRLKTVLMSLEETEESQHVIESVVEGA
jgi:hypothetical protein